MAESSIGKLHKDFFKLWNLGESSLFKRNGNEVVAAIAGVDYEIAGSSSDVSQAVIAALGFKSPLDSPIFTGIPSVPTASNGTNNTQIASTSFVKNSIDNIIAGAPGALDTLNEIAIRLTNDENAVSALTNTIGTKLTKSSNLSDLTDTTTARTNLGLGSLATQSGTFSGTSSGTNTGDQDLSGLTTKSSNLSDLTSVSTARNNLGLGNVNNTSDANKPVSTAQQLEFDTRLKVISSSTTKADILKGGHWILADSVINFNLGLAVGDNSNGFVTISLWNGVINYTGLSDYDPVFMEQGTTITFYVINGNVSNLSEFPIYSSSAETLSTPRTINGVSFNGSTDISITVAASTLTGTSLASNILTSSLTSAGGGAFGTAAFTMATAYATVAQGVKANTAIQSISTQGVIFATPVSVTNGVASLTLLTQGANTVLAGPSSGVNATPTMRALVAADIPALSYASTAQGITANDAVQSVTIANGVSATKLSGALTFTLGSITPTSVTASGNVTGSNLSGTNNGDETLTTIKSKLGVTILSGSNTGDQTTVSGNAGTATALQTPRTINDVSFDGSANIAVTVAASTLTGTTLPVGVISSSLTSVGTISTGVWQGTAIADAYIVNASTWNAKQSAITFGTGVQTAIGNGFGTTSTTLASGDKGVTSLTLNNSGLIHTTPLTFTNNNGVWSAAQTLVTQIANTVLVGPISGANATPSFRTLIAADIPVLSYASTAQGAKANTAIQSITTSNVLFTSPVAVSSGTASLSLLTQPTYSCFGNFTGTTAAPTFDSNPTFNTLKLNSSLTGSGVLNISSGGTNTNLLLGSTSGIVTINGCDTTFNKNVVNSFTVAGHMVPLYGTWTRNARNCGLDSYYNSNSFNVGVEIYSNYTVSTLPRAIFTRSGGLFVGTPTLAGSVLNFIDPGSGSIAVDNLMVLKTFTVATLPTTISVNGSASNGLGTSSVLAGSIACVSDSDRTLAVALGTTVVGGGTNFVKVYYDGSHWKVG